MTVAKINPEAYFMSLPLPDFLGTKTFRTEGTVKIKSNRKYLFVETDHELRCIQVSASDYDRAFVGDVVKVAYQKGRHSGDLKGRIVR